MYGRLSQIEFHETAISRNETHCCLEFIVNITGIINFLSKKKEYLKTKYFEFLINVIIIYSSEYFIITFLKFKNINICSGNFILFELWKTVWNFLKKLKMELPFDPAIPLLGLYPKNPDTPIQKNLCAPQFTIAKGWKQPKRSHKNVGLYYILCTLSSSKFLF